jgi:hypothetical protein
VDNLGTSATRGRVPRHPSSPHLLRSPTDLQGERTDWRTAITAPNSAREWMPSLP